MIEWTEQALRQLDHAHDHIAFANSKEVAARITPRSSPPFNSSPLSPWPADQDGFQIPASW
jgi:hypothetical protein